MSQLNNEREGVNEHFPNSFIESSSHRKNSLKFFAQIERFLTNDKQRGERAGRGRDTQTWNVF